MSQEIRQPKIGEDVFYFPLNSEPGSTSPDRFTDQHAGRNSVKYVPAKIVQPFGLIANIIIFGVNEVVHAWSVPHKSSALEGRSFWDYTEA